MSDTTLILGASDIYPKLGSTLQSCCRDMVNMRDWYGRTFNMSGANYFAFLNARYTKKNFFACIRKYSAVSKKIAIGLSDHGTTIPVEGVNHAAIVFSDSDWNDLSTFATDADFAALFAEFSNVHYYMTADACESGPLAFRLLGLTHTNKFIEPEGGLQQEIEHNETGFPGAVTVPMFRSIAPILPNVAYISGTGGQGFYSIDEGDGGTFTKHLTKLGRMSAQGYADSLDSSMDKLQQPQPHGGLKDLEWLA